MDNEYVLTGNFQWNQNVSNLNCLHNFSSENVDGFFDHNLDFQFNEVLEDLKSSDCNSLIATDIESEDNFSWDSLSIDFEM